MHTTSGRRHSAQIFARYAWLMHTRSASNSAPNPAAGEPLPIRTLDDAIVARLPQLTKRERRRLVSRGGVTINGEEVRNVLAPVQDSDDVHIPTPGPSNPHPVVERPTKPAANPAPSSAARASLPDVPLSLDDQDQHSPQEMLRLANEARAKARREEREPRSAETPSRPQFRGASPTGGGGKYPVLREPRRLRNSIRVMHEDDDIMVVEKPPGVITADPTRTNTDTLFDILKEHLGNSRGAGARRRGYENRQSVWVIHRLDKEASGLLVFAKTPHALDFLKEEFRAKRVHRMYVAVAEGVVGPAGHTGTCQSFLREEPGGRVTSIDSDKFRGAPGDDDLAKLAITHYKVLASRPAGQHMQDIDGTSLLQIRLETGRKHQIRAHMGSIGHPLVGDYRYEARTDGLSRLALHAAELGFSHPRTGLKLRFASPAPASFYRMVGTEPPAAIASRAPEPIAERPITPPVPVVDPPSRDTSWDRVAAWYDELLDDKGNDHYEHVILPGAIRLVDPVAGMRFLDVACGQGVLCRRLGAIGVRAVGVDLAPQLISAAQRRSEQRDPSAPHGAHAPEYHVGDARELGALKLRDFDAAACIMALGNIDPLEPVFSGIHAALKPGASFTFVISHPAFRAPGQTAWEWDQREGKQYRRVDGYLSQGHKRIQMHPGADPSVVTWTFHRPLQLYARLLGAVGFAITELEEWPGMRISNSGPRAQEENRARREIPLFVAIKAIKRGS